MYLATGLLGANVVKCSIWRDKGCSCLFVNRACGTPSDTRHLPSLAALENFRGFSPLKVATSGDTLGAIFLAGFGS